MDGAGIGHRGPSKVGLELDQTLLALGGADMTGRVGRGEQSGGEDAGHTCVTGGVPGDLGKRFDVRRVP